MPTLIFKETEACNSNCVYCDVIARKKPRTITYENLEKVFVYINEFLQAYPEEYFSIVWHGGEPCIVGVKFYEKVLELQNLHCAKTKDRIKHDVQTNLTLINEDLIRIFESLGVNITTISTIITIMVVLASEITQNTIIIIETTIITTQTTPIIVTITQTTPIIVTIIRITLIIQIITLIIRTIIEITIIDTIIM